MSVSQKHRLVTRSDFDGLVCAVLLKELDLIDEIVFVHPKDVQDGKVDMRPGDISTNLPYMSVCHLVFDHHHSETVRLGSTPAPNHIIDASAPSAARVVFNHYGGATAFPGVSQEMMDEVDKCDAARFTRDEVLNPAGWTLLGFLMDARTGLGRFKNFRVSNYQLMMHLIEFCRQHTIDEILELPDVKERVDLYREQTARFETQIMRCARLHGEAVVVDLRDEDPIYAGNRFMVYAIYPDCNVSLHVLKGLGGKNTVFAIGKSIFNRSSEVNIGELCLAYGGGGHANAGTCQVPNALAEAVRLEFVEALTPRARRRLTRAS